MTRHRRVSTPLPPPPPPGVRPYQRLRTLRMERSLSLAQLAALAGVRKATLVSIERGQTLVPNQATLARLATVFGMTVEELRRQTGMHGPLYVSPVLRHSPADSRRWSQRAEHIAGLVDTLPAREQELIETLCRYLQARRNVSLPAEHPGVLP